jgi:anion-transporting  ArsA/GET3 family ATPase
MADFFSSRLLRWLIAPYRSRMFTAASKPFYSVADRVLGAQFLQDIAEFFVLFQTMYDGFVERANAVTRTLEDRRTSFVVVTTLDAAPAREAEFFAGALAERRYHLGAVVCNRMLPPYLTDKTGASAAETMKTDAAALAALVAKRVADRDAMAGVLREIGESFLDYRVVAAREAEQLAELSVPAELVVPVPALERDVATLADVLEVGAHLW